jgi:acyl-coenzyme A thioesterase PaaI-like protein
VLKDLPKPTKMITLPHGTNQGKEAQGWLASDGRQNKQPNSNFCFVCGRLNERGLHMTFHDNGKNEVFSEYTVPEDYQGYPGIVHGGIVAAMLDEVVGRVAMIGDHHHFMLSVRLEVKYRQIVPTETPLRIVGRIKRLRGRLGKAVGQVILPDGTIAAESELTLADIPQEWLAGVDLDELGWRIDP